MGEALRSEPGVLEACGILSCSLLERRDCRLCPHSELPSNSESVLVAVPLFLQLMKPRCLWVHYETYFLRFKFDSLELRGKYIPRAPFLKGSIVFHDVKKA